MADFDTTPAAPVAFPHEPWAAVRAAATANVGIHSLEAGSNLGGVTLVEGDRFLLSGQTDARENGIFSMEPQGADRSRDADDPAEFHFGRTVRVTSGTAAGTWRFATAGAISLGVTELTFTLVQAVPATLAAAAPFSDTPPGTIPL